MSKLPQNWTTATIGEVTVDAVQRELQKDEIFTYIDISSIDRQTKRISDPKQMLGRDAPSRARKVLQTGDVLVSMTRPNLNAVAIVPETLNGQIASTGFDILRAIGINSRWLFYLVQTTDFILSMSTLVQGALYPAVRSKDIRTFELPLAPSDEQKRIADKLDVLLARVDTCRDRLDRVRLILDRFRQSVLLVAMSGELTEDWRQVSRESAEWQNVLLSEICVSITDGTHQPPPQTQYGIPFITIAAINTGRLQIDKATRFVSSSYFEQLQASRKPELGDILFSVTGSIAIPALVDVSEPFMFQRHIAILKPDSSQIIGKFLLYSLSTENIKRQAQAVATGTAQKTIPLSGLRGFVIDLPSIDEQQEIVRRVESLFDYADRLKSHYQKAYNQVEQLTPALLAKAFSGELVPQNSNDEPASALLDRIRAERATQPINPKRVLTDRKPKMTKMSEESVKEVIRQLPKNTFSFDELCQKLPGDYESIRDILFFLLDEPEPSIMQIFDQEAQAMCFTKE